MTPLCLGSVRQHAIQKVGGSPRRVKPHPADTGRSIGSPCHRYKGQLAPVLPQDYHFSSIFVIVPFQDRECTLLEPSEDSPVSHLIGQPMTACQLLPVKPLYCTPFSFHWVLWYYCYCRDSRSVGSISTLSLTDTNTAPSVTKYALIFFPTE